MDMNNYIITNKEEIVKGEADYFQFSISVFDEEAKVFRYRGCYHVATSRFLTDEECVDEYEKQKGIL